MKYLQHSKSTGAPDSSRQKLVIYGILLAFIVSILFACSAIQKGNKTGNTTKQDNQLSEKEKVAFTRVFFNANKQKILGNLEEAAGLFSQCLRKDPSNAAAMYELAGIYNETGKVEEALFFAKKAAALEPENEWYQLLLADIYKSSNLLKNAIAVYEDLVKNYPARTDYYLEWATILLYSGKLNEAANVLNKIEQKIGVSEEISLQKERIYIRLNKIDKAIDELKKLIDTYPMESRYIGMLAELYKANGMNDKALET